jgi:hypothetical protein
MTSAPILPSYLGLPFRILVSPFVKFDPVERTTDILMFNSKNLGALIVDEDPHVKSWEDGHYGIHNMAIEETYGFGILNEGQAIAVAKNVKVRPNEFVMPHARCVRPVSLVHAPSIRGVAGACTIQRGHRPWIGRSD